MNYLLHLFLADPEPACMLGNLMGDFVKGRLDETYPPALRRGIWMHRKVDSFAHDHAMVRRSKGRLDSSFGHYRAIMVDIFYDHYLARDWDRYAPLPLEAFAREVYRLLLEHEAELPAGLKRIAPRMIRHNWLVSYRDLDTIDLVLQRIGQRIARPNPLGRGISELRRNYSELAVDFDAFLPQSETYVRGLKAESPF